MRREARLTPTQIARWAREHHSRTGRWPTYKSGEVRSQPGLRRGLTWSAVHWALYYGNRGLRKGSSLAKLLDGRFGVRGRGTLKPLSVAQILRWADAHKRRTGAWPTKRSGAVRGARGETWNAIAAAISIGGRGLPTRGSSLATLLQQRRGRRNQGHLPKLTIVQVLQWADDHHRRTGRWPSRFSGRVAGASESWAQVESAMHKGSRGMKRGSTLPKLLQEHRGVRNRGDLTRLTIPQVLAWADAHHRRTGRWPTQHLGAIIDAPQEKWSAINMYLRQGRRGLPSGTSLPLLLIKHRGIRSAGHAPRLTEQQILKWADAHHDLTGRWPGQDSGVIPNTRGETWSAVHFSLYSGFRGLPGGSSLARLLERRRGVRNSGNLPPLTHARIIDWANRHHDRSGEWPKRFSGPVTDSPADTWNAVDLALYLGGRGLRGGSSLLKLLVKHCGKRDPYNPPRLSIKQLLAWADDHYHKTGVLPGSLSGRVLAAEGENWSGINDKLTRGGRGLPGGIRLSQLMRSKRPEQYRCTRTPLTRDLLLEWIASHHELTGAPPTADSGPVIDEAGETWGAIDASMRNGHRRTRGRMSLETFIEGQYSPLYAGIGQRLTHKKIAGWVRDFRRRTGTWPTVRSAYVFAATGPRSRNDDRPGERWTIIDRALREGRRGLRGGSSLARVVAAVSRAM